MPLKGYEHRKAWEPILGMSRDKVIAYVRRDELEPGDEAFSSHYGVSTVESVYTKPGGLTTHITWKTNNPEYPRHEIYDSDSHIPLIKKRSPISG